MTLYRNTSTGEIFTDAELTDALRPEIEMLDDETMLQQEFAMHGDAAIREYIIECCLVGIYSKVDDGDDVAYKRVSDGRVFYAAEIEQVFIDDVIDLPTEAREYVPFNEWLNDRLLNRAFVAVDADEG